jgi:hypothetical protein
MFMATWREQLEFGNEKGTATKRELQRKKLQPGRAGAKMHIAFGIRISRSARIKCIVIVFSDLNSVSRSNSVGLNMLPGGEIYE